MVVKAFAFDFDGTLYDLYTGRPSANLAVARMIVQEYSLPMSPEDLAERIAEMDRKLIRERVFDRDIWWRLLLSELGIEPDGAFVRRLSEVYWRVLVDEGYVYEDVIPALEELSKAVPLGLMADTDGTPGLKRRRVEESGLARYFSAIVIAGEDTEKTKPDPEPFAKVAEALGVSPRELAYVGDSPHADAGGRAIGVRFVLVVREHNRDADRSSADAIIWDLRELLRILEEL